MKNNKKKAYPGISVIPSGIVISPVTSNMSCFTYIKVTLLSLSMRKPSGISIFLLLVVNCVNSILQFAKAEGNIHKTPSPM